MKFPSMILLMLVGFAHLAAADDDAKTPPRSSGRPAVSNPAPANTAQGQRAPQTVTRHPVVPSTNANSRSVNVNPTAQRRSLPVYRSQPVVPGGSPNVRSVPSRTTVVTPNQRPNPRAGSNRLRLPSRTGNEMSFAQAQAQNSQHRHDRDWWRHHHTRICFYGGGYWFWNAGWWFPAWGYSPYYNNYVYDGPIYGYGELSPGDVTAQVQEALAQQGYYYGAIDGVLGPETRDAILRFQADHGLATTAAIDEATLDTLGLT